MSPRSKPSNYNRVLIINKSEDSDIALNIRNIEQLDIMIDDQPMCWKNIDRLTIEKIHASLGRYLQTVGYKRFEEGWTS